jgi:hypothetical protein
MQTIKNKMAKKFTFALASMALLLTFTVFLPSPVAAAGPCDNPNASEADLAGHPCCERDNPTETTLNNCLKKSPILKRINQLINFLSAGVGIVIVGSLIYGGIQYSWAGDNSSAVSAAKDRIRNALIALIAFFFIFAFLQWLVPGGLLFS